MIQEPTLSASEAAAELGVSLATLYAYVSRGMIRSIAEPGRRQRRYAAADIRRLARKAEPEAAPPPLYWGQPVLESAITLVAGGRLYYRGRDAVRLAESATLESVAGLLWTVAADDPFAAPAAPLPPVAARIAADAAALPPMERAMAVLPALGVEDDRALARSAAGLRRTGARLLRWLTAVMLRHPVSAAPAHEALAEAWGAPAAATDLLRRALVLCADHELTASTFAARIAASTGASPHAAVAAGLAALNGPLHGGLSARTGAFLEVVLGAADARRIAVERLQHGEDLPGFGHTLYPEGDPRGQHLLDRIIATLPDSAELAVARTLVETVFDLTGERPTLDFALVLAARLAGLPPEAPLAVFALGRSVGWMAHVMEQYAAARLIRPRARYVGPQP
ncbi:citrate/2-methylcitrate synthase [Inquilinus sp.]|jgi:citrate synthase|uniref:citrate/2-methylcitrate synthase n=1 Tax=Inquilinus sp. TaxID=1932117 RepID=UPI0037841902